MNKQLRMQCNEFYNYININPKGKYGGDCVVRAIALATGQSWEETVRDMTEFGIKKGLVLNDKKLYPLYLEYKGFAKMSEPRYVDNTKMSVREWIRHRGIVWIKKKIIVNVGSHHLSAIIDGKINDTWDCSDNTMHQWWIKL